MNSLYLTIGLLFIGYISAQQCALNEEYQVCGTACPDTCTNYNDTDRVCNDMCKSGCFCQKPYVRQEYTGECVKVDDCHRCKDPNEYYTNCGTACPLTCKNFSNPPKICNRMCVIGCACKHPYVRDEATGRCVVTDDCLAKPIVQQCGLNEEYQVCGTACPDTCTNYNDTNRVCVDMCKSGCFCQKSYVRQEYTGECVKVDDCHKCKDPNKYFTGCGTACPLTCKNFSNPPKICNRMCVIGCACKHPYVRDEATGRCVVTDDCLVKPIGSYY